MRLFRAWVEDYIVNEQERTRSVSHIREADGNVNYDRTAQPCQEQDHGKGSKGGGKGKGNKGNKQRKDHAEPKKEKTEDQLARAVP